MTFRPLFTGTSKMRNTLYTAAVNLAHWSSPYRPFYMTDATELCHRVDALLFLLKAATAMGQQHENEPVVLQLTYRGN